MSSISWELFELQLLTLGRFKCKEGDIVWVGIRESIELSNLWEVLHDRLKESDFKVEDRPFTPHITLGRRIKPEGTDEEINKELSRPMPGFIADRLHLYHSTSENECLEYKKNFPKQQRMINQEKFFEYRSDSKMQLMHLVFCSIILYNSH